MSPLTSDLENHCGNAHSHDEYLCQVSLKCLYVQLQGYHVTHWPMTTYPTFPSYGWLLVKFSLARG